MNMLSKQRELSKRPLQEQLSTTDTENIGTASSDGLLGMFSI